MIASSIQWTDHTWNIAVGCKKVDADCRFCYMYRDSLNNTRYDPKVIRRTKTVFNLPLRIKEPGRIFTCSLTDFFLEEIDEFRAEVWDIIRRCPQHTFQVLTKRPERIAKCLPPDWGKGWDNVWLGTSIGSQESIHRLQHLIQVPAKVRFLSLEPLHGPVHLDDIWVECPMCKGDMSIPVEEMGEITGGRSCPNCYLPYQGVVSAIDWVIIGGESGNDNGKYRYRPCELKWIEDIVKECKVARVPVFVKQLGTHISKQLGLSDRHAGIIEEFPKHLQIRQFPSI